MTIKQPARTYYFPIFPERPNNKTSQFDGILDISKLSPYMVYTSRTYTERGEVVAWGGLFCLDDRLGGEPKILSIYTEAADMLLNGPEKIDMKICELLDFYRI